MTSEVYISVDVETSGDTPLIQNLLSLGAVVVGEHTQNFYVELRPWQFHRDPLPQAMAVNGLDFEYLLAEGESPGLAISRFKAWVEKVAHERRPVFVSFGTFDWMWIGGYLDVFGKSYLEPFGPNSLDLKSFYMGWRGTDWRGTMKSRMPPRHLSDKPHTHNALEDALEQAIMFECWIGEMLESGQLRNTELKRLAKRLKHVGEVVQGVSQ